MNPVLITIALLLSVAYWRHIASALAAGVVVLACRGIAFFVTTLAGSGAGTPWLG